MEKEAAKPGVLRSLIKYSLPFLATSFLQTLYGMADLVIIGRYEGVESTAAVAIGSQVMHMLTVIIVGLAMGCSGIVSSALRKNDRREAERKLGSAIIFFSIIAAALTLLSLLFTDFIVLLMCTPDEAVSGTEAYLRLCFLGLPFIVAFNVISSIYTGMGKSRTPVWFVLIATVANIVLDIIFMGRMHMGATGAALGTVLSQAVSVIIALLYLAFSRTWLTIRRSDLSLEKSVTDEIMQAGAPIASHDGLIQVAFLLIVMIMNRRGLTDAAAAGIVEKIISLLILVPSSIHSAVTVLCSECGDEKRSRQILYSALAVSVVFGLVVSFIIQLTAQDLVSFFTHDGAVINGGADYLRGYVYETVFSGIHYVFSGYFTALGMAGLSSGHNIISIVFMRIPGVYFLSLLYPIDLYPVGLASASGSLLSAVICIFAYIYLANAGKIKGSN